MWYYFNVRKKSGFMQTFIFGHQNPDTDSVCASIALSYLMNADSKNTVPKVIGHINQETKFVLDYFGVKCPDYLNDTKVRIKDVKYNKKAIIYEDDSILSAFSIMQKQGVTSIPLIDDKKLLKGFVSLKEVAKYLISGDKNKVEASYDNILENLEGIEVLRYNEEIVGNILVAAYQSSTFREEVKLTSDDILIVGDRYKVIEYGIDAHVKLIVLSGNHVFPLELLKKAKENKVNIIVSKFNSFDTASKMVLSNKIKSINVNSKPIVVDSKEYRTDFLSMANKANHTNYPVVNSKHECLGMLKITQVDNYQKQKVILVDHNGLQQSAIGIEEADIVEIIDHHNLSTVLTHVPINFRCMPVGCTCTIIYNMFVEKKIAIPKHIAGLMLSAILSDTLIFKSPTSTEDDVFAASKLAKLAKVDIEEYGFKMFKAASSIQGLSVVDVINQDFKVYNVGNKQIGISQVMTLDFNEIEDKISEYIEKLNDMRKSNFLCAVLFITDVYKNGSYVIYNSSAEEVIMDAFQLKEVYEGVYIPNLVSRKKQMLPALMEVIEKRV